MTVIETEWISPVSSFLILSAKSKAKNWLGFQDDQHPTHFDIASNVDDWVSTIHVHGTDYVVFGGDILQAAWAEEHGGPLLVRWIYADSTADVASHITDLSGVSFGPPFVRWYLADDEAVLFESALAGREAIDNSLKLTKPSSLVYPLEHGTYRISSAHVAPDESTSLLLHRFERVAEAYP